MAFKVLTEEQISLLTENQKKQYENELDVYNARVAFVERIKIIENAEIPPYEPDFRHIAVNEIIPEKNFNRQEYTVKICDPIIKPEPKRIPPVLKEPVSAVLPKSLKIKSIEARHIKKKRVEQPVLPKPTKIDPVVKIFEHTEGIRPTLPGFIKPTIKSPFTLGNSFKLTPVKPEGMQNIVGPKVPVISMADPEKSDLILPEIAVNLTNIRPFEKVGNIHFQLPEVVKPYIAAVSVKNSEPVQAELPELKSVKPARVEFHKLEALNAELPAISKPNVDVRSISPVVYSVSDLTVISKPKTNFKVYKRHEYEKSELPTFEKINVIEKPFRPVAIPEHGVTAKQTPIVRVNSFVKIEARAAGLPNKTMISVPDAYEKLRELTSAKNAPETLEEAVL